MAKEQHLFRDASGEKIKDMLNEMEGISFQESPLDFFILLARYKFAARQLRSNFSVADAGCGHGHGTVLLTKFAGSVTGLDCDAEMIKLKRSRFAEIPNLNFELYDHLNPNQFKCYDAVISMDVIEHFNEENQEKVAASICSLLKEDGFAIIGTPSNTSAPYASVRRKASHLHEFSPQEFETLLRGHFRQVFMFSMTDEAVSTSFIDLAWYLMAICTV